MSDTTVGELAAALAALDPAADVWVYADLEGEWVRPLPYCEERAVVCGYYAAERVCATAEGAVIMVSAEAAL